MLGASAHAEVNDASPDATTLQALIVSSARGDERAFSQLYTHTAPRLLATARMIVNRWEQAEEVLQDAFVQIWNRAGEYETHKGAPIAWLASIVRYRALDKRRREGSQAQRRAALAQEPAATSTDVGPLEEAICHHDLRLVLAGLDTLKECQRQCIVLAYYHGYTRTQLADRFGVPSSTVKSWLRRGLMDLRGRLGEASLAHSRPSPGFGLAELS